MWLLLEAIFNIPYSGSWVLTMKTLPIVAVMLRFRIFSILFAGQALHSFFFANTMICPIGWMTDGLV